MGSGRAFAGIGRGDRAQGRHNRRDRSGTPSKDLVQGIGPGAVSLAPSLLWAHCQCVVSGDALGRCPHNHVGGSPDREN